MRAALYEEYNFNFSESFIANIQWALVPIVLRWTGAAIDNIPKEHIAAWKDVLASLKLAQLTKLSGWKTDSIFNELFTRLKKAKPGPEIDRKNNIFEWKYSKDNVTIKNGIPYYNGKKVLLPENKSFYIENSKGILYRVETGKGWSIEKVFNVETNGVKVEGKNGKKTWIHDNPDRNNIEWMENNRWSKKLIY